MGRKTEIVSFNVNWNKIKQACMRTIGKEAGKAPGQDWKRKLLLCQHSPLRRGTISWKWNEIPFYVMGHFVRHHVGCTPYVSTSRSDRTDIPREERRQTDMVSMEMDANVQSLIDMSKKRLCYQADKTTREYMEDLKDAVTELDEDVAWAMVPECIRDGACPEFYPCGFFDKFAEGLTKEELMDMRTRYDKYNERYAKIRKLKK